MPTIPALPTAAAPAATGLLVIDISGVTYSIALNNLLQFPSSTLFVLSSTGAEYRLNGDGSLELKTAGGADVLLGAAGSVNIASGVAQPAALSAGLGGGAYLVAGPMVGAAVIADPDSTVTLRAYNRFSIGFSYPASTLGTVIAAFPIYDLTGTLIGYVPIYDSIS